MTDAEVPAVCESCLGPNPYVQMLREKGGAECKICTRPFTVFKWLPKKGGKYARTVICMTCARQKNCCQSCMNDLTYGLPLAIRDAALKLAGEHAHSANSANAVQLTTANNIVQKQYEAQNYEAQLKNGIISAPEANRVPVEESARELLQNLSEAMKKNRSQAFQGSREHSSASSQFRESSDTTSSSSLSSDVQRIVSKLPLNGSIMPPSDTSITSLFIAGIEEDLPDYKLREHFGKFGTVKSLTCVHRARAGYVVFKHREEAEAAAKASKEGRFILDGCKLKLSWGKVRPLGSTYTEQAKVGQIVKKALRAKAKASK